MKKIVLICPYFGKLPKEYFQLTLNSCRFNETIDWLLITDDKTSYTYPKNVKVIYKSFEHFSTEIKNKYKKQFKISISTPYKLCDFKPLYGEIFSNYIKEYDFWGYTDMTDVLYGNLRSFITDDILNSYEKIGFLGHLTLYKNSEETNKRYRESPVLQKILETDKVYAFDELGDFGIQSIYNKLNISTARIKNLYADISPLRFSFQLSLFDGEFNQFFEDYKRRIFEWKKGKLLSYYVIDKMIKQDSYGYLHFQKRRMKNNLSLKHDSFLIVPNKFIDDQSITLKLINSVSPRKIYLQFFKLKFKALISHFR